MGAIVELDVAKNWTPDGWKRHEAKHLPVYEDAAALAEAEATLGNFPPLVFAGEALAIMEDSGEEPETVRQLHTASFFT